VQGVRGVGGSVQAMYRRGRRGGALRSGHRAAICTPRLARGRAQHSPSPPRRARARRRSLRASPLRSVWSRRSLRPTAATARGWHSGCASCSRPSRASSSSPSARRWPCFAHAVQRSVLLRCSLKAPSCAPAALVVFVGVLAWITMRSVYPAPRERQRVGAGVHLAATRSDKWCQVRARERRRRALRADAVLGARWSGSDLLACTRRWIWLARLLACRRWSAGCPCIITAPLLDVGRSVSATTDARPYSAGALTWLWLMHTHTPTVRRAGVIALVHRSRRS